MHPELSFLQIATDIYMELGAESASSWKDSDNQCHLDDKFLTDCQPFDGVNNFNMWRHTRALQASKIDGWETISS